MAHSANASMSTFDAGLKRYLDETRRFPMLKAEEECLLAQRWREHGDRDAAQRIVTSHLRLVAKLASGYRGYGLPGSDLIAEGNLGLMRAIKGFEPEKGFRFATYAVWWIKASIQEYIRICILDVPKSCGKTLLVSMTYGSKQPLDYFPTGASSQKRARVCVTGRRKVNRDSG